MVQERYRPPATPGESRRWLLTVLLGAPVVAGVVTVLAHVAPGRGSSGPLPWAQALIVGLVVAALWTGVGLWVRRKDQRGELVRQPTAAERRSWAAQLHGRQPPAGDERETAIWIQEHRVAAARSRAGRAWVSTAILGVVFAVIGFFGSFWAFLGTAACIGIVVLLRYSTRVEERRLAALQVERA